jgi:hypothetical protein
MILDTANDTPLERRGSFQDLPMVQQGAGFSTLN